MTGSDNVGARATAPVLLGVACGTAVIIFASAVYPRFASTPDVTYFTLFVEAFLVSVGSCLIAGSVIPARGGVLLLGIGVGGLTLAGIVALVTLGFLLLLIDVPSIALAVRAASRVPRGGRILLLGCVVALIAGLGGEDFAARQIHCPQYGHDEGGTVTITGPAIYECSDGRLVAS